MIGLPTLRLRGDYLAIVTLGFGEILPQIARNGDNFFGHRLQPDERAERDHAARLDRASATRSRTGPAASCRRTTSRAATPTVLGHQIQSTDVFFWTAIVLLLFTVFCSLRLQYSRLGRAWIAIREDETAAAAMGDAADATKTWAYASGAFFGGIAGAYYATFKSATFPGDFFFNISVFILCMVILGGMGNISGVIVGGAFLAYLNQEGLANTGAWINATSRIGTCGARRIQQRLDVPLYRVRHLRVDHPDRDALPTGRADPVETRGRRAARRRARRAAVRRHRTTTGS